MKYQNRGVVITGASSGIGRELAKRFAEDGAKVALLARREERLRSLEDEIRKMGASVISLVVDVADGKAVKSAMQKASELFGSIDVVVANAGFGVAGALERLTLDDYRRQFDTNVFGVISTASSAIPYLKRSKGQLVLVGSVVGFVALPGNSAYSMSKFCVRALAQSLSLELAPEGVSVTHIAPGFVKSEIRQVNNRGVFMKQYPDPIPSWLSMSTERASRKIFTAIRRRRREAVITVHGKIIVWFAKHLSFLVSVLMSQMKIHARAEPV